MNTRSDPVHSKACRLAYWLWKQETLGDVGDVVNLLTNRQANKKLVLGNSEEGNGTSLKRLNVARLF